MASPLLASDLAALLGDWATRGTGSLAARLAFALRSRILADLLPPGTALPPERPLADALAVSRSTLVVALDLLRSEGLLTSRQGSGTRIAGSPLTGVHPSRTSATDERRSPTMAARLLGAAERGINFGISAPPAASHLPGLSVSTADLLAAVPPHGYDPAGLAVLRAALADRHTDAGLPTTAAELQVTHGAQHAIDLALAMLCRPGAAVAVEDPTYPGVLDVIATRGLQAVPLAADARGPTPAGLEAAARDHGARVAFLLPAVHNPTGRVLDPGRRQALARALDRREMTVVEDNTLAELAYDQKRPPELAALCRRATVVTVETTSKVAWGGLRVGWLRGPAGFIERSTQLRTSSDLGCSVPAQLLALRLLDHYDKLIAARRAALRASAARFAALLAEAIPGCSFAPPAGGLSLWVRLPGDADAAAFASRALRHGVSVAPGQFASSTGGHDHLRLCHDRPDEELTEGIARLAAAWAETTGTVVSVSARP
ncbi:MAG TPA: PLP-dependent aminotransferase family protein [Acidimicrobiia bacterium]|jgi:DNA-binding transcriptional MocR family regulator|nr:PLP-dependent aminotransferase family protein [Acidimicrobiia bacterium]